MCAHVKRPKTPRLRMQRPSLPPPFDSPARRHSLAAGCTAPPSCSVWPLGRSCGRWARRCSPPGWPPAWRTCRPRCRALRRCRSPTRRSWCWVSCWWPTLTAAARPACRPACRRGAGGGAGRGWSAAPAPPQPLRSNRGGDGNTMRGAAARRRARDHFAAGRCCAAAEGGGGGARDSPPVGCCPPTPLPLTTCLSPLLVGLASHDTAGAVCGPG